MSTKSLDYPSIFALEDTAELQGWLNQLNEPAWLKTWRKSCWEFLPQLPWPESRYTRLRGFQPHQYRWLSSGPPKRVESREENRILVTVENGGVQSIMLPSHARNSVEIFSFHELVAHEDARLRTYFTSLPTRNPIRAGRPEMHLLGTWADGLWIETHSDPKESPLEIVIHQTHTKSYAGYAFPVILKTHAFTHTYVIFEQNASRPDLPGLSITGLDITVGHDAQLELATLQNDSESVYEFNFQNAAIERNGQLTWASGWFGGRLFMGRKHVRFEEPGAALKDTQVLFGYRKQHFDLQSFMHHIAPNTTSYVNVRAVLKDLARSIFYGLVRIDHDAKNADAFLQDHVLLLNPGAHSDSIPALEIEENDVRCKHSASVGQIDEEKIFYAMSRGLDESTARRLIVTGFLEPALSTVQVDEIRERIVQWIDSKWIPS